MTSLTSGSGLDEDALTDILGYGSAEVLEEGKRADTKAGHLLSAFGLLLAAVVAIATKVTLPLAATVTLWVSAAPLAAALVRLLWAIRPRVTGAPYLRYSALPPDRIRAELREYQSPSHYRADRIHHQSAAVVRKYRAIRAAVGFVLIGGTGLILTAALAVLI